MLRLKTYDTEPPGGFAYTQSEGIARYFPPDCGIKEQAYRLSAFRKQNNLPRSDFVACFEDIDVQTANRVRSREEKRWNRWVLDTEAVYTPPPFARPGGCGGCGAKLK